MRKTMVAGKSLYSFFSKWYLMAKSIKRAMPTADIGVSISQMPRYIGNTNPIPPKIFERQMKYLMVFEYSFTQLSLLAKILFGIRIISIPDVISSDATTICTIQSIEFIFF